MNAKTGGSGLEDLIDELARVVWEAEQARTLVRRAGFPPANVPAFSTAQVFWARVMEDAANGMLLGGVRALVDEAAKQFPGNGVFAGYRGQAAVGSQGGNPSGPLEPGAASPPLPPPTSPSSTTSGRTPAAGSSTPLRDDYDVFLSHSSADKPAVEEIAVRLRDEAGLRPFLDKWHLVPGESWMPALERALERSTTVAVFFGPHGRGAWHDQESQLALVLAAEEHGKRVIPVLLPGARKEDVGGFIRLRTWVELAQGDGFERLVAGVTGQAPGPSAGLQSGPTPSPGASAISNAGDRGGRVEPSPVPDAARTVAEELARAQLEEIQRSQSPQLHLRLAQHQTAGSSHEGAHLLILNVGKADVEIESIQLQWRIDAPNSKVNNVELLHRNCMVPSGGKLDRSFRIQFDDVAKQCRAAQLEEPTIMQEASVCGELVVQARSIVYGVLKAFSVTYDRPHAETWLARKRRGRV